MSAPRHAGALVHEWVAQSGGSENVFEALSEIFPQADLYCLWNDSTGRFEGRDLNETWLARTPLRRSKVAALPFMPATWSRLGGRDYDWVLISSHLFAHHARFRRARPGVPRYVYVHTPARYIWNPELDGRGSHALLQLAATALKPMDRRAAQRPDTSFAANSAFVKTRIQQAWGVDASVIYPPVDVEAIQAVDRWSDELDAADREQLESLPQGFVLGASRFIPYKRLDLVVRTGEVTGRPVVLAGRGPELKNLQRLAQDAAVPVHILEGPSTSLLRALYERTALYVFPAVEDFGIMPVEAMAAGARVLAQAVGGTAESVVQGETGALVAFAADDEIRAGVEVALSGSVAQSRERARAFSRARFVEEVRAWVRADTDAASVGTSSPGSSTAAQPRGRGQ